LEPGTIRETMSRQIRKAVDTVVDSGLHFVYNGEECRKFEDEFAHYIGTKHAVMTSSGTAALHLCLIALGIGHGDEVLTVSNACTAVADPILMTGAKPVFVDIEEDTLNMDPSKIEQKITGRTKAIEPVHLYGNPVDSDAVSEIAEKHNILVIEDTAQGAGSRCRGKMTGTSGKASFFSFADKNITVCGEGGMLVTEDENLATRVKMLRHFGRRNHLPQEILGYNYCPSEIHGAIGRVQLRYLDTMNELRREKARWYEEILQSAHSLSLPSERGYAHHVYFRYVVRTTLRDKLKEHLLRRGIHASVPYPHMVHLQKVYRDALGTCEGDLPVTEKCNTENLALPMNPWLDISRVRSASEVVLDFLRMK